MRKMLDVATQTFSPRGFNATKENAAPVARAEFWRLGLWIAGAIRLGNHESDTPRRSTGELLALQGEHSAALLGGQNLEDLSVLGDSPAPEKLEAAAAGRSSPLQTCG